MKTLTMIEIGTELSEIRAAIEAVAKHVLTPLNQREDELRTAIQVEMESTGTKTFDVADIQIQRRTIAAITIVNEDELIAALKEKGLYESCLKTSLDKTIAKRIGAANEMPGIGSRLSDTISVVKRKPDPAPIKLPAIDSDRVPF